MPGGVTPVLAFAHDSVGSRGIPPKAAQYFGQFYDILQSLISLFCALLVVVDVVNNNWELNDYIGNAYHLLSPLLVVPTTNDLSARFSFPPSASPQSASDIGQYLTNTTIAAAFNKASKYYFLDCGSFLIQDSSNDICGTLVNEYPLPNLTQSTMRLGILENNMQYLRGSTLSNFFGSNHYSVDPTNHSDLIELGYLPARVDIDMRLTTPVTIPSTIGTIKKSNISMYRYGARSFCTGSDSYAVELGLDTCFITYYKTPTTLVVQSSRAHYGNYHILGAILQRTASNEASLYLRGFSVLLALAGYATSKKTVRWTDPTATSTILKRIGHTVTPPLYRYNSHTFGFSNFCFNSDIFVITYVLAVLLDENNSMMFSRLIYHWNLHANGHWAPIQIFAVQFRWLWINCLLVKVTKILINYVSMTRFSGSNILVGFFNFSDVTYLYIGAIFLFVRTNYIEYGNSDKVAITHSVSSPLDGVRVDLFDSWYIRAYPGFILVMILNLLLVLTVDKLLNRQRWRQLAKNSLGRQYIFNSSSILTEMCYKFHDVPNYNGQAVQIETRALCTLQWFLTCHTMCFGLPEDPKNVRAIVTRINDAKKQTASSLSSSVVVATYDPLQCPNAKKTEAPTEEIVAAEDTSDDVIKRPSGDLFIIAQDSDGCIHMYDNRKQEIQAMSLEVKILNDSRVLIA